MKKNRLVYLLFVCGLLLVTFPFLAQVYFKQQQGQLVDVQLSELAVMPETVKREVKDSAMFCNEMIASLPDEVGDPFAWGADGGGDLLCDGFRADDYFSSLEIPKLNERIPIYIGASEENLAMGVGQVEGSSLPNGGMGTHSVLAGHRGMAMKAMFRHLDELAVGDVFYVNVMGERLTYTVYDVAVILPHETESLTIDERRDLVSLITCHPYPHNSHRLVVYGERES